MLCSAWNRLFGWTHGGPTNRMTASTSSDRTQIDSARVQPRAPVLDWGSFRGKTRDDSSVAAPGVHRLAAVAATTSGRAALYQALRQLDLSTGDRVLVPTYHCPTMIAPVRLAGCEPLFFGLRSDGLPDLAALEHRPLDHVRAMIVAHYFGIGQSLAEVRAWCDARGIALVEDCAHCLFGNAGDLQIGAWGDFATASLSKFLPVPEGGLLASNRRRLRPLELRSASLFAQIKGVVDVIEHAAANGRLRGVSDAFAPIVRLKRKLRSPGTVTRPRSSDDGSAQDQAMHACDMVRADTAPLWISTWLNAVLPREPIAARRRRNFAMFRSAFEQLPGARPLLARCAIGTAPYVFPLWIDEPDRVFALLRSLHLPVYRWDRPWPGTPSDLPRDVGPLWSHHVLQFLCHQDLRPDEVERTVAATRTALGLLPTADALPPSSVVTLSTSARIAAAGGRVDA